MFFVGKKYKRVSSENFEKIFEYAHITKANAAILKEDAAFSITREDDDTFVFTLYAAQNARSHTFKFGEETEVVRRDGGKSKVVYHLEAENVLIQEVQWPFFKAQFRRVFKDNRCILTITPEGIKDSAIIYYQVEEMKMSFLGKKFKRVASENLETLIEQAHITKSDAAILLKKDTGFTITPLDHNTYLFTVHAGQKSTNHAFRFDEEAVVVGRDGGKSRIVYHLESENVLIQHVQWPSKEAYFRRVFDGNRCVLTITTEGWDDQAKICYEIQEKKHSPAIVRFWDSLVSWKRQISKKPTDDEPNKQTDRSVEIQNNKSNS